MNARLALRVVFCLGIWIAAIEVAAAERPVDPASMAKLASLRDGSTQVVDAFPAGPTTSASIAFHRARIYADDARIYVVTADGESEIPRSDRIFVRGYSADRSVRIAMTLNPDGSFADGNGSSPEGAFALRAHKDVAGNLYFNALLLKDAKPPGYKGEYRCSNDATQSPIPDFPTDLTSAMSTARGAPAVAASSPSPYSLAVIAVDTDSLFMSLLFSDNAANAATWIAKLFNTMNTMYEGDLNVQLVQGTTFLRVGSDPYGAASHVPVDTADVDVFAAYWKANYGGVKRAFATLLSGRGPCSSCGMNCISCSASGKAWINQYCQTGSVDMGGHTVGSYSVEQLYGNLLLDPNADDAARLVGHEFGHNFGADHTHCTDKTTAQTVVATNTIDQCYNGESGRGCYAGGTSCAAGGNGTIMSYCNISGCGTDNLLQFNDKQISITIGPKVTAATPACLLTDRIFAGPFE